MTYLICWANDWDVFRKYFVYRSFCQFNLFEITALFRDFLFCSSVRFNHCSYKVFELLISNSCKKSLSRPEI